MIVRVDTDELNLVVKQMRKDSEDFNKEIETMIHLIKNELPGVWRGVDAKTFIENVSTYLERMKVIPKALTTLSNVTEKINKGYEEDDESFGKALEGVANKYAK